MSELTKNEYFAMDKIVVEKEYIDNPNIDQLDIYTCVDGTGVREGEGFKEEIKMGDKGIRYRSN